MRYVFFVVLSIVLLAMAGSSMAATTWTVGPTGPPTYNHATIQDAVNVASAGDTIYVSAGTYTGTINIDGKSNLIITGENRDTVIVKPSSTLPWNVGSYGTSRQTCVRVVNSTGISISSITFDFDTVKGNFVFGGLSWDSTIVLDNNVFKNVGLPDASGYYYEFIFAVRAPSYTDSSRADVTFSNNIFTDTGRVGINIHDFVYATIENNTFTKTWNDFGYAIELGSRSTGTIKGNTISGYDTPALSDGSESAGIYVENAFTGGLPHVNKPVTIVNNNIYDNQFGLWIGNGYDGYAGDVDIQVVLSNNNIHDNIEGGILVEDEDRSAGSSVTLMASGNTVANNGTAGYYFNTYGDGELHATLTSETITGQTYGILIEDNASGPSTSLYDLAAYYCDIFGNTTKGVNNTTTTLFDARDNWWGTASGPGPVGPGSGDQVSANVDYTPWLTGPVLRHVAPVGLASGKPEFSQPHGTGTNPFGWDWDSNAPDTAAGAPPCWGDSSFYASVIQGGATPADRYRTFRIGLRDLFKHPVTIGDVASISYYTNKPALQTAIDWRLSIYTTPEGSGNVSSWYRNRIQSHPAGALNLNAPADQWNLWSTDSGENELQFSSNRTGFSAEDMLWSELASAPVTRGAYTWDYSGEEVMMIDVLLGANSGGGTGSSQLDGISVRLTDGECALIDLTSNDNVLYLVPGSVYLKGGASTTVELKQKSLNTPVTGFQAFLSSDTNLLAFASGVYTSSPYGLPILSPIAASAGGDIDLAAGIDAPGQTATTSDDTLANLTFTAGGTEGITNIVFRFTDPPTRMADAFGNEIAVTTMDSAPIVIDNTAPAGVSISAVPSSWTNASTVTLTFSATDSLSGIDHYELSIDGGLYFTATSTYALDVSLMADGTHQATVKAVDRAGNEATASTNFYLDETSPSISIVSAKQNSVELIPSGTAIQGAVNIQVTASDITSGLNGHPAVTVTPNGGSAEAATYVNESPTGTFNYTWAVDETTPNGTATINATISDNAANPASATTKTFNVNKTQAVVTVQLEGVTASLNRWIKFVIGGTGGSAGPLTITRQVAFTSGVGTETFTNLDPTGDWTRISAKDEQHTLRQTVNLQVVGPSSDRQYSAAFTVDDQLIGGDVTNDNIVDILDFGVFAGQYNTSPSLDTTWSTRNANISCDGNPGVGTEDFTYIQQKFLSVGDTSPSGALALSMSVGTGSTAGPSPRASISVKELAQIIGMKDAQKADVNKDKVVDAADMQLFHEKHVKGKNK